MRASHIRDEIFTTTITAHSGLNIRTDEDIEGIDHFGVDPVVKDENEMNKHLNKEDKNTYKENIKAKHVRKEHMGGEIKKDDHGIISKSSRICCDHMMKKSRRAQFVAKRHYAADALSRAHGTYFKGTGGSQTATCRHKNPSSMEEVQAYIAVFRTRTGCP